MAAPKLKKWQHSYQPQQDNKKVKVKDRKNNWITKGEKLIYSFADTCLILFGIYVVSYSSSTDTLDSEIQINETKDQNKQIKNERLTIEVRGVRKRKRITKMGKEYRESI